jgi:hypothetical protein
LIKILRGIEFFKCAYYKLILGDLIKIILK